MKAKTINAVVTAKFNEWVGSITDPALRELVKGNSIMTGGAIASMLMQEKPNDFDFYFRNLDVTEAVAKYYLEIFKKNPPPKHGNTLPVDMYVKRTTDRVQVFVKSAGIASEESGESDKPAYQYFEMTDPESAEASEYLDKVVEVVKDSEDKAKPKYRPVLLSSNAITLSNGVQLVLRFSGEPDKIHENYDFVHCTNYWTSWHQEGKPKLVLRQEALESILAKELRYVGSKYPLCSLVRMRKFINRGWTINAGQILKIAMNLQSFNLRDVNVLEGQLTGVDVAYFHRVLSYLKENYKGDQHNLDSAYLIEIIDRMF